MPVTYTNRKNKLYYLCRGVTKKGKPHYYFSGEPKGEPVEQIPDGYEIRESVNGFVSLAKKRPVQILPGERAAIEAAIEQHPKARNYRIDVKGKQITVYERTGPDAEELSPMLRKMVEVSLGSKANLQTFLDETARYAPVMRFTLSDQDTRTFQTERWCYRGRIDGWIDIGPNEPLHLLARRFIPLLGTHALYDVLW